MLSEVQQQDAKLCPDALRDTTNGSWHVSAERKLGVCHVKV